MAKAGKTVAGANKHPKYLRKMKPITAKINMVKTVFKHNIVYSARGFRTPSMSEAFEDKYLNANKKGLLFLEQPLVFSGQTPFCSP